MKTIDNTKTDFLVIGSGIAGLTFALKTAEFGQVVLITKKQDTESNTNYAQGGIAAVLGDGDTFEQHIQDTLTAGAGLCDRVVVEEMVRQGPACIDELIHNGVDFSTNWSKEKKVLSLGREGGHSQSRIVHKADFTGREVEQTLVRRCQEHPNIEVAQHLAAVDLAVEVRGGKRYCIGAFVVTPEGEMDVIVSRVTMLASGGCGQVYLHTTNPPIATGDGIAMAYRAGAKVANLEFMQFHPTTLYPSSGQSFLISEAVRGFGGILRTLDGVAFMKKYHHQEELAPRDIVARAIDAEMKTRGEEHVWLDITGRHPDEVRERFPSIYKQCLVHNIDITHEWIPVVPAAHYMCGGVIANLNGQTSLAGLYAAGEVACTGVHGANRLASNSLLEAVVFSHRAAEHAVKEFKSFPIPELPSLPYSPQDFVPEEEWILVSHDRQQIAQLMWNYVGIVRSNLRLERARRRVELIRREVDEMCSRSKLTPGVLELRNIALVADLIIKSALMRKESRGLHFNTDFPNTDNSKPPHNTVLTLHLKG